MSPYFLKIWNPPPNSRCQKGDMKQGSYWGPTVLQGRVYLTVSWCFLFGVCEMIHISVCKKAKTAVILLEILGAKFIHLGS